LVTYTYEAVVPEKEKKKEKKKEKEEKVEEKEVTKEKITREEIRPDGTKIEEKIEKFEKKEEIVEEPKHHHHDHHDHGEEVGFVEVAPGELVKRTTTTTIIDPPDHHHHHQDLAVMVPARLSDAGLRREIKALEAERKALQLERAAEWRMERADRIRDGDWEFIEREREKDRRPRNVVRVEKDRKGRMALVRSVN
jgi:hypothetical protein